MEAETGKVCVCAEQGITCKWCTLKQMQQSGGLPMTSEIKPEDVKLPPLPEAEFILDGTMSQDGYTADQMREYARLAVLQERARCSEIAWPHPPAIKLWSLEEAQAMMAAEQNAEKKGKGHYETLFAIAAAALKICAERIRAGHSVTETKRD